MDCLHGITALESTNERPNSYEIGISINKVRIFIMGFKIQWNVLRQSEFVLTCMHLY